MTTRYLLRTTDADGRSHGGFQWPESGPVSAPDWLPTAKCGNGLHGLLDGVGDAGLLNWAPDARWLVVTVDEADIVDLDGKVKVPRGKVIHCGDRASATAVLDGLGAALLPVVGSTRTAGYAGTATAGDAGTATAGDAGTATAGDAGTATAGDAGTATAGYAGTATAGYAGTATAGDAGTATAGYAGTATAGDGAQRLPGTGAQRLPGTRAQRLPGTGAQRLPGTGAQRLPGTRASSSSPATTPSAGCTCPSSRWSASPASNRTSPTG